MPLQGGAPIVKRSDGSVSVVAPAEDEEVADPALRDALLKEPALTIATPENRPASAPPGETVMIAGPDDRLERLQREVSNRGWPGYDIIGRRAASAAFHVVRRAKTETIKELLPAIIAAAESGQASKIHAAFLEDLVRVREGLPQRYGTQVRRSASGGIELAPVEDAPGLDDRRAAIGLPPSAEFLASLRPPE